jgi:hypothetical protein
VDAAAFFMVNAQQSGLGRPVKITGSLVRTGRQQLLLNNAHLEEVIEVDTGSPDDLPDAFLF